MRYRDPNTDRKRQPVHIDPGQCSGCGFCSTVCPSFLIDMVDQKAVFRPESGECMNCAHCAMACPSGAISVDTIDPDALKFKSFKVDTDWLPHGEFDTGQLVRLMASRRSCRNFSDRPVPRPYLDDLVKIGLTAPSGTNSQKWTFSIVNRRPAVLALGEVIAGVFERINQKAQNRLLRWGLKMAGSSRLDQYYRKYYQTVKEGLRAWRQEGKDRLFHGAPALMMIGSSTGASCPTEDALLAAQNILLGAHCMGLGTCLVGFAVAALQADASIQRRLGIPEDESIHAVIAVGYPAETYARTAQRMMPKLRFIDI